MAHCIGDITDNRIYHRVSIFVTASIDQRDKLLYTSGFPLIFIISVSYWLEIGLTYLIGIVSGGNQSRFYYRYGIREKIEEKWFSVLH